MIWDFNGTILDDMEVCRGIMNGFLKEFRQPLLSPAEYREVFRFPVEDYYDAVGVTSFAPFAQLAEKFTVSYKACFTRMGCFPDIRETLVALRDQGCENIVLSATAQEALIIQLKLLKLDGYFSEILGISDIYAAGKSDLALQWRRDNEAKAGRILLIGDSDHDWEVAQLIRADCVLICRGHMSRERLMRTGAPVFNTAKEMLEYLDNS